MQDQPQQEAPAESTVGDSAGDSGGYYDPSEEAETGAAYSDRQFEDHPELDGQTGLIAQ